MSEDLSKLEETDLLQALVGAERLLAITGDPLAAELAQRIRAEIAVRMAEASETADGQAKLNIEARKTCLHPHVKLAQPDIYATPIEELIGPRMLPSPRLELVRVPRVPPSLQLYVVRESRGIDMEELRMGPTGFDDHTESPEAHRHQHVHVDAERSKEDE
jgi:hypothetical protein